MLDFCLADSRILYFWYVLKSIHKFMVELPVLQCLFVRGLTKSKGRVGLFQISLKERPFHLLWQPSALGCNFTKWHPLLAPFKKGLPLPFSWPRREYTWHSIETAAYWFILKIARMFSILTGGNRIINTLIIVNITPTCKRL